MIYTFIICRLASRSYIKKPLAVSQNGSCAYFTIDTYSATHFFTMRLPPVYRFFSMLYEIGVCLTEMLIAEKAAVC